MVEWQWRPQIFTDQIREILAHFGMKIIFYFIFFQLLIDDCSCCLYQLLFEYQVNMYCQKLWTTNESVIFICFIIFHQSFLFVSSFFISHFVSTLNQKNIFHKHFCMIKNLFKLNSSAMLLWKYRHSVPYSGWKENHPWQLQKEKKK